MVICVKSSLFEAEKIRKELIDKGLLNRKYKVTADKDFVYLPVIKKEEGYDYVEKDLSSSLEKPMSLKDALEDKLSDEELENLTTSFDTIGKIIIIDIKEDLVRYEGDIADALLKVHHGIETVCKRAGKHEGEFRIRPVEIIGGKNETRTEYKESGAKMYVDVNKVYFTPRLSHERERIAEQVKEGEEIAYFFAGVGPFALVIAKKEPKTKIYSIELNPEAYELMKENIALNKMDDIIIPILGDVTEQYEKLPKCDRVIMPLPKDASDFLKYAFKVSKKGATIHYYQFSDKSNPYDNPIETAMKKAKEENRKIEIKEKRIVRPFNPTTVQVVLDILVLS